MGRLATWGLAALVAGATATPALADGPKDGQSGPNRESTQGDLKGGALRSAGQARGGAASAGGPAKPTKQALPVSLSIVAPTPDPPWAMKVENTGDHPIRIAADVRLLSFELEKKGGGTLKCAAPAGLRPSKFPNERELYLKPGESFEQAFDPRLYCFNGAADALTDGTIVHPHYGFGATRATGPFAAQGLDRPEAFAAVPQIDAPSLTLSFRAVEPASGAADQGEPKTGSGKTSTEATNAASTKDAPAGPTPLVPRDRRSEGRDKRGLAEASSGDEKTRDPFAYDRAASAQPTKDDAEAETVDLNKARVEVFVDRYTEASAARDIVVNIKAANEGRRDLVTALRGRMLSFSVEQLAPDGTTHKTVDCSGADRPHGVAADMMHDLGAGQSASVPLLLAEICPPGTFNRPGLYRVLPRIDTSVDGEALKLHAYIGKALAKQSTLVRLATGKDGFEDEPPRVSVADAAPTQEPAPSKPTTRATQKAAADKPASRGSRP